MMLDLGSFRKNVLRFLANLIVRYCFGAVIVFACWIAIINYNYWFSWHVILCTLGIIPLMSEALMLFPSDELWSRELTRLQKYWIHGILMILGTVMISIGSILTFHYVTEGYHLYTAHGITGLISMILFILSLILGCFANYAKNLTKYGRPMTIKFLHNFIGLLGLAFGIISLCYAYYTEWFIYYTSEEARIVALLVTIFGTLWCLNAALLSCYDQLKSVLEH